MKFLPFEIWRDIPGYEGLYQASSIGNIRSLDHYVECYDISTGGVSKRLVKGKLLVPGKTGNYRKYYSVSLCKNGITRTHRVAVLVMLTFVGPRPDGMEINHIDENTFNNSISNLEYCTKLRNNNWGTRKERISDKLSRPIAQLTIDGKLIRVWVSQEEIKRRTNYTQSCISRCCNGKQKTAYGYKWNFYENWKRA